MNILFVCTGNICRSPMAEFLAKDIIDRKNTDTFIFSRGISATDIDCATLNAILALKKYGIDLTKHKSKQISKEDIVKADIILTMTTSHKEYVTRLFQTIDDKIFTLKEYAGNSKNDYNIDDPYGCGLDVYERCAEEIKKYVEKAIERLGGV